MLERLNDINSSNEITVKRDYELIMKNISEFFKKEKKSKKGKNNPLTHSEKVKINKYFPNF